MNTIQKITHTLFAVSLALIFSTPSSAEPPNLAQLTHEIKAYHDSGEYQKELTQVTRRARDFIMTRVKINQQNAHPEKLAIILDIDETSLSNYNKMVARQFVATREQLHREIMAADSPAIQPVLTLYQEALRHGITVFFITGRRESERQATHQNLKKVGFYKWADLYLRPDYYSLNSIIPFKSKIRAAIVKKGYTIIASIGDQCSDLKGGYVEKTFKLPNPYYYLP